LRTALERELARTQLLPLAGLGHLAWRQVALRLALLLLRKRSPAVGWL
jgi:hypothetical protein